MKRLGLISLVIILVIVLVGGLILTGCVPPEEEVKINEIMFDPVGDDAGNEWIELYSGGNLTININGWTISNRIGETAATLPDWDFPNGTYLVVHFGIGVNDNDFSDGEGHYYTGDAVEVFNNAEDEVAVYNASASASTIVNFVSYCFDGEYNPGVAHDYAVSAGIWDSGDYFGAPPPYPWKFQQIIIQGESIGRDRDSTDTNQPEDWDGKGGKDAVAPTPGSRNIHELNFVIGGAIAAPPQKEWTIMAYIDGDNDVEKYMFAALDEMEQAGSDDNINIVFQFDGFDRAKELSPVPGRAGKAWRGYLEPEPARDPDLVRFLPAPDGEYYLGEVNMGAPATLTAFVQWASTWFPANKYMLIISNHGAGWKGVAIDETSGEDWLYMGELKSALAPVPLVLDILGFEACLMGMIEVGYQVYEAADILVASEEVMRVAGWSHNDTLMGLKDNPGWSGTQLATRIVNDFHTFYTNNPDPSHTLSAINLNPDFLDLVSKVDVFADDMLGEHAQDEWGLEDYVIHQDPDDNVQILVRNALLKTEHYEDANYIDLYDFMKNIEAEDIPPEYMKEPVPIMNKLVKGAGVVIEEKHGPAHCPSHGLSIYFPTAQTKYVGGEDPFDDPWPSCITDTTTSLATYAEDFTTEWGMVPYFPPGPPHPLPQTPNFDFRDNTLWDEFLHRYYKPVADAGEDQFITVPVITVPAEELGALVTITGRGSSDSDGSVTKYIWDLDTTNSTDDGDWDRDGVDEADDDNDAEFHTVQVWLPLGTHIIKLTVWDDHTTEGPTPEDYQKTVMVDHSNHWKTDQDHVTVEVITESEAVPEPYVVTFADPNLETAVRVAIAIPDGPIYALDLEWWLTSLDASERNIADLTGLEFATSLTELDLRNNQISDISPVANLTNLISLDLCCGNQITDISPLANLTSLTELGLCCGNQISDVSPLVQNEGLGTGDYIGLWENPLSSDSVSIYIPQLEARGVTVDY